MRSLSHLVPQAASQPIPLAVVFEKASPLVASVAFEMQMRWSCDKLPQGTAISRHLPTLHRLSFRSWATTCNQNFRQKMSSRKEPLSQEIHSAVHQPNLHSPVSQAVLGMSVSLSARHHEEKDLTAAHKTISEMARRDIKDQIELLLVSVHQMARIHGSAKHGTASNRLPPRLR